MPSTTIPIQYREERIRLHTRPVHYRWSTPDGAVHHASTVLLSRTRAGLRSALKRFFVTNRHVDPDPDSAIGNRQSAMDFTATTAARTYHHQHQGAA